MARRRHCQQRSGSTVFHDLRHHYSSLLIHGEESVKTVQARLGHASTMETLDTHGRLWPNSENQTRTVVQDASGAVLKQVEDSLRAIAAT
jgi:integrase